MITGALRSKVDSIWNTMWSGGISNPAHGHRATHLPALHHAARRTTHPEGAQGRPHRQAYRGSDLQRQAGQAPWSRFKEAAPEQMFETVRDGVFPLIKRLGQKGEADGEGGSTLQPPYGGRPLHDAHGPGAGQRGRPTRRHRHGRQRHQGRPLRVHCSARSPSPDRTVSSARRATSSV